MQKNRKNCIFTDKTKVNESGLYVHISDPKALIRLCEQILATTDNRLIIQKERTEILTLAIRREINRPGYGGESSFLSRMVRILCHTYDFRHLKDITRPIEIRTVYNEAIRIWGEITEDGTFSGLK